jgi:hypothetical protein
MNNAVKHTELQVCGVRIRPMPQLDRITLDLDICHGKPFVRHMRWPVEAVLDLVSAAILPICDQYSICLGTERCSTRA